MNLNSVVCIHLTARYPRGLAKNLVQRFLLVPKCLDLSFDSTPTARAGASQA